VVLPSLYSIYEYLRRLFSYGLKTPEPISCLRARERETTALLDVAALLSCTGKSDAVELRRDDAGFVVSYMNVL
jgi:hypothetical protein